MHLIQQVANNLQIQLNELGFTRARGITQNSALLILQGKSRVFLFLRLEKCSPGKGLTAKIGWSRNPTCNVKEVADLRAFDLDGAAMDLRENVLSLHFVAGQDDEVWEPNGPLTSEARRIADDIFELLEDHGLPYLQRVDHHKWKSVA